MQKNLKEISSWFAYTEEWHAVSMLDSFWQWETDFGVMELFDLRPTAITSFYNFHFDDLDRMSSCAMTSSHVSVALGHSTTDRQITVFTVHVVGTRSGVIPQPDSKVLDLNW